MGNPNVTAQFAAAAAVNEALAAKINSLPYAALADCVTYRALVEPVVAALRANESAARIAAAAFDLAIDSD